MRRDTRAARRGLRTASDIAPLKKKNLPSLPKGIFIKIQCTDCGAQIGAPCISSNGNVKDGSYHTARKHKAMQKWHAERELETVELPEDSTD